MNATQAIELSIQETRTVELVYTEELAVDLGFECDSCEVDDLYWGGEGDCAWQVRLVPSI